MIRGVKLVLSLSLGLLVLVGASSSCRISGSGQTEVVSPKRSVGADRFSSDLTQREIDEEFNKILEELYSSNWLSWYELPDLNDSQHRFMLDRLRRGGYSLDESYGPYKFIGDIKPLEELTEKELLLLGRVGPVDKDISESVPEGNSNPMFVYLGDFSYKLADQYLVTGQPTYNGDAFQVFYGDPMAKEFVVKEYRRNPKFWLFKLSQCLSPITGKPIVLNAEEFSPGNAYFRVVTEKEYLRILRKRFGEMPEPNCYYVYYRVYGEKEVIAEGITLLCVSSYHARLKSSKDKSLALASESSIFTPCGCRPRSI